jgi:hypothetical protein
MVSLLYLPTASEDGRLYYTLVVAATWPTSAVRSDTDAGARALSLSLCYSTSQQTWPDNKAEQAAVGDSITPSEVKRRRVEWFVICQPLPGSCWVAEASKQRSSHANRPSVTCFAHVPCPSEAVMSLLSQRTVCLRTAVDVPLHLHTATLQLCNISAMLQNLSREALAVPELSTR